MWNKPFLKDDMSLSNFWNYFVWLRITNEGSVPEMRTWSILLINPILYGVYILVEVSFHMSKWCHMFITAEYNAITAESTTTRIHYSWFHRHW